MREVRVLSLAEKVDPKHTALVVVDVQNDFCADGGALHRYGRDMSMIQGMVPNLVDFIDHARKAGAFVVFVRELGDEPYLSPFMLERRKKMGRLGDQFILDGTWGADFYKVKPLSGEPIVTKYRMSGFAGTDLDLLLRSHNIQTVVTTGVATNVCVEHTARDAFSLDYYVVFVEDCMASDEAHLHQGTLENIRAIFGDVCRADEVVQLWQGAKIETASVR